MQASSKLVGVVVGIGLVTILACAGIPGCFKQNQDNSPISINNSQGRPMLSVTCSQDGAVVYVADGRNVYRYDRSASAAGQSWECILSQGQRLEMAAKHDPREPLPSDTGQGKQSDAKPSEAGASNANK